MITLFRGDQDHYTVETGLAPPSEIANGVNKLPREWINEDGISMSHQFLRYATPLIQGETPVHYENGLPAFVRLDEVRVDKIIPRHPPGRPALKKRPAFFRSPHRETAQGKLHRARKMLGIDFAIDRRNR